MHCRIRKASLSDMASVAPLFDAYRQFYDMPADLAGALDYLTERVERNESVILFAEGNDDVPLGFCQLYFSFCSVAMARIAILYDLFVDRAGRGNGTGKALLQAAETCAAQAGAVRIHLQTAQTNYLAQGLYEGAGWSRNTRFFGYAKMLATAANE